VDADEQAIAGATLNGRFHEDRKGDRPPGGRSAIRSCEKPRHLAVVEARADVLQAALPAALDGTGPALLPMTDGPGRDGVLAALRPDEPLERGDVALVVPTSGSTGVPKGALLTASALLHSAHATLDRLGGPGQWLLAMPLTHVAGLQVLVRSLVADLVPVVLDLSSGFTAEAFVAATSRLSPQNRRYTALVPTQLRRLLDAGVDLSAYDAVLVGGAALPFAAPGNVVRTYGMSETCGGCVYDGVPLDGVDVVIEEGGRISIGGPVVFAGYRLRPDLTTAALVGGRHLTHDLGTWNEDGRLVVVGRVDDVIVSGGINVPAGLVEAVLSEHPSVTAVAVVGVADEEWGERVVAVVVGRAEAPPLDLADVQTFCDGRLDAAAIPRLVVTVDALPMLASGKPDRSAVRSLVAAHLAR
jgi:O-succinylbenzoic acid--CoA ligase